MKLDEYKFGFFDRFLLKWETRDLGANFDRLAAILPCVIYSDKMRIDTSLQKLKRILENFYKQDEYVVPKLISRVVLRILEYKNDEKLYLHDRSKMFDILVQNIQLYSIVIDIFDTKESAHILQTFDDILKEKFDKEFSLNKDGCRILAFQEKYSKD